MAKRKIIDIDEHALLRTLERGLEFGLDYYETKELVFKTVRVGRLAVWRHRAPGRKTYYLYFKDNLSFYAICQEREFEDCIRILIRTIIIEKGRE